MQGSYHIACSLSFSSGIRFRFWTKSLTRWKLPNSPGSKPWLSCRTNRELSLEMISVSISAWPGLKSDTCCRNRRRELGGTDTRNYFLTAASTPNAWLIKDDFPTPVFRQRLKTQKVHKWILLPCPPTKYETWVMFRTKETRGSLTI